MARQDLNRMVDAVSRRLFVAGMIGVAVSPGAFAAASIGTTVDVRGKVDRRQPPAEEALLAGAALMVNDLLVSGGDGFADLKLGTDTRILLGHDSELLIDRFVAEQGGVLELGSGAIIFDRPKGLSPVDITLRTTFGMIGVRGTKFFCGPNRGKFAVFVEHGRVEVSNAGVTRRVERGQGIDIAAEHAVPSRPVTWKKARIAEAYASVVPS